jgi:hypothetical protein
MRLEITTIDYYQQLFIQFSMISILMKEYKSLDLTKLQNLAIKLFICEAECDCKDLDIRISCKLVASFRIYYIDFFIFFVFFFFFFFFFFFILNSKKLFFLFSFFF